MKRYVFSPEGMDEHPLGSFMLVSDLPEIKTEFERQAFKHLRELLEKKIKRIEESESIFFNDLGGPAHAEGMKVAYADMLILVKKYLEALLPNFDGRAFKMDSDEK